MPWRSSSTNGAWTPQQRLFLAIAVLLCLVALGICAVRLQSAQVPTGPGDGTGVLITGADGPGRR